MEKIEISIELLAEIQEELRNMYLINFELHGQVQAIRRCLNQVEYHMPKASEIQNPPQVIAKINHIIEKESKKKLADAIATPATPDNSLKASKKQNKP